VRADLHRALEAMRPKARRISPSPKTLALERSRLRAKVAGTRVLSDALRAALDLMRRDVLGKMGLRESDSGNGSDDTDAEDELFWAAAQRRRFAGLDTGTMLAAMPAGDRRRYQDALEQLDGMSDAEQQQFAADAQARGLDADPLAADARYWAATADERPFDAEDADRTLSAMTPEQRKRFEGALEALGMDADRLADAFGPAIEEMYRSGAMSAQAELGTSLDMHPEAALAALAEQTLEFAQDVVEREREGLRAVLAEGIAEGDSIPQIGARIKEYFADGMHITDEDGNVQRVVPQDTWIEQVARTETTRAFTGGLLDIFYAAKVAKIQWLAADDERTCDQCEALDGEIVALGDNFPGSDFDSPPGHPSCRCVVVSAGFVGEDDDDEAREAEKPVLPIIRGR
jgi:SPP1 gp7 family putative phage head morphogenesis protein